MKITRTKQGAFVEMSKTTADYAKKIEKELARLDAGDIGVYLGDSHEGYPAGWACVSDGTGTVFGPANSILAVLRQVARATEADVLASRGPGAEIEFWEVPHLTFERIWDALSEFAGDLTADTVDGLVKFVRQIEEGSPNDNPAWLVSIETDHGTRWACGPDGTNYNVVNEAYASNGYWYESEDDAIDSWVSIEGGIGDY